MHTSVQSQMVSVTTCGTMVTKTVFVSESGTVAKKTVAVSSRGTVTKTYASCLSGLIDLNVHVVPTSKAVTSSNINTSSKNCLVDVIDSNVQVTPIYRTWSNPPPKTFEVDPIFGFKELKALKLFDDRSYDTTINISSDFQSLTNLESLNSHSCSNFNPLLCGQYSQLVRSSLIILPNIVVLDLSYIRMKRERWEQVCDLCNLESLTLKNCNIRILPDKFCNLQNLSYLDLSNNQSGCANLNRLTCENINQSLKSFFHLTTLILAGCRTVSVPIVIAQMHKLEHLDLSRNALCNGTTQFADSIGKIFSGLTKLTKLLLNENFLESLPIEICNLPNLAHLEMWGPCAKRYPNELYNIKSLVVLNLGFNVIMISPLVFQLTNLRELYILDDQHTMPSLTGLPEETKFYNLVTIHRVLHP